LPGTNLPDKCQSRRLNERDNPLRALLAIDLNPAAYVDPERSDASNRQGNVARVKAAGEKDRDNAIDACGKLPIRPHSGSSSRAFRESVDQETSRRWLMNSKARDFRQDITDLRPTARSKSLEDRHRHHVQDRWIL